MEILKCYEGGGDKEKATKWDEISHAAGGNARTAEVCLVPFPLCAAHFKFFMAELNFRVARCVPRSSA